MKFYNDGWKQLEQNIFDPHAVEYIDQTDPERPKITTDGAIFPILRLITYNREMDEYYNRHFSLPNNKLVSFNRPRGGVSPKIPFLEATFAFQNYKLSKTEVFARWTTMMTNGFLPLRNNLPYLQRGYEVEDYLKALFGRTNVYYAYDKLKRSYPKKNLWSCSWWKICDHS